jgi:hypothetical protein
VTSFAYQTSKAATTHLGKILASVLPQASLLIAQEEAQETYFLKVEYPEQHHRSRPLPVRYVILVSSDPEQCSKEVLEEMSTDLSQRKDSITLPRELVPLERPGSTSDIGGLILYLSSKAGGYVNGNVSIVDGGRLSVACSTY